MKKHLKIGLLWGLCTAVVINALKLFKGSSFEEIYMTSDFLVELLIYLIIGAFFFSLALKYAK